MTEVFDPNFEFAFNCEHGLDDVISSFTKQYDSTITTWHGGIGQTSDCYIDFHSDSAYDAGKSDYQHILFIAGKLSDYSQDAQKTQRDFAMSIRDFLTEEGCDFIFTAYFSIDS